MSFRLKPFIFSVGITLGLGILSGIITGGSSDSYELLIKPPLSPPAIVFPIAWTILYTLMGVAAGIVLNSNCRNKDKAIKLYFAQLIVNVLWPIIFFSAGLYVFALLWLILLDVLVVLTTFAFYNCKKSAGYLLLPYLIWLFFATYLNFGIVVLN